MKKTIAILSLSAVAVASVQTASAGNEEWATVGKVLTGVAAVHVLSHAFYPRPVYASEVAYTAPPVYTVAPAPVVAPTPVYVQPAPVVVYPRPIVVAPRYCARPILSVNFGFGHHHHHHGHRHCR